MYGMDRNPASCIKFDLNLFVYLFFTEFYGLEKDLWFWGESRQTFVYCRIVLFDIDIDT